MAKHYLDHIVISQQVAVPDPGLPTGYGYLVYQWH